MDTDVQQATKSLAAATIVGVETPDGIQQNLSKYSDHDLLCHWSGPSLPDAPAILEHAVGVVPDLEWNTQPGQGLIPELEGKITQVGYTVFPMKALRDCKTPGDFLPLLKKAAIYYIRVIENCHLRSKSKDFKDTEKNPLFCPTRFVTDDDAKATLQDVLDHQLLADGTRAPVILIGHGWHNDETRMKEEWGFRTAKLSGVVRTIYSLGKLAVQAGISPALDRAKDEKYPKFDAILQNFGVVLAGTWRHNGANDAVYQMTLAFIIILYPILFPDTSSGYPSDPTINGLSINDIWVRLAEDKEAMAPLSIGHSQFCFYCEIADDHDSDACPNKDGIICQLCENAVGKKNAKYRGKAKGHQASRCGFQYKHNVRKFPDWLEKLDLNLENKRTLSRGMALKNFDMIGEVFYTSILGPGPMGNDEVKALEMSEEEREKARLKLEAESYSDGESEVNTEDDY